MAHEPKKRHSKAAKRTRRASINLSSLRLLVCSNCNSNVLSHIACTNCGFFKGKLARSVKQRAVVTKA